MKTLFDEDEKETMAQAIERWADLYHSMLESINEQFTRRLFSEETDAQERFRSAFQEDTRRQAIRHTTEESPGVQVPG
jgi:tellurite resistance protein